MFTRREQLRDAFILWAVIALIAGVGLAVGYVFGAYNF